MALLGAATNLYARLNPGGDVDLGTGYLNAPHRYRIEWRTGNVVEFFIDGVSVNSRTASFGAITMRPGISDYNSGGPSLSVDWITQTPYVSPCTFTSRVIDAGQLAHWIDLSRVGATPAGTSVGFETRTGNTATPDGTWSGWQSTTGATASPNGRYIQYRATLATTDPAQTPVIESVTLTYMQVTRSLDAGWNLLALPLQPINPLFAQDLLENLNSQSQAGNCTEVDRWYLGWDSYLDEYGGLTILASCQAKATLFTVPAL